MNAYRLYNGVTESIPYIMFGIMGICGIARTIELSDYSVQKVDQHVKLLDDLDRIKILENQAQYYFDRSVQLRIAGEDTRVDKSFSQANILLSLKKQILK
ncbi:MAG: hypothetical protein AABX16_03865 [Nanoarchaeota archaeon]